MTSLPSLLAVSTVAPWPIRDGYTLRVANILQNLAQRWSIVLIAPASPDVPACVTRFAPINLLGRGFTYPWRFDQTPLRLAVDQVVRDLRPDRALVWPGAEAIWFGRDDLPPAVADLIDCNFLEFWRGFLHYRDLKQRYWAAREIAIAVRYARCTARAFASTICVGVADARWQRRIGGGGPVHVIPNGVTPQSPGHRTPEAATPTLCFTGTLDYQPNIEAVRYAVSAVWPRVLAAMPTARFMICGRNPSAEVVALGSAPGVELRANVPDMSAILGHAWAAIAPMRSGVGIKNKVLEAWSASRPVVMTSLATNGLIVPPDHAALVRDTPAALAEAVLNLFENPDLRQSLGHSALTNVTQNFTWDGAASRVDALLRDAGDDL